MTKPDVLIVGGGIGGLTAALCFAGFGYPVQVFEQGTLPVEKAGTTSPPTEAETDSQTDSEKGAGIQLSPN